MISTIGPRPVMRPDGMPLERLADKVTSFWQLKLESVLPDRPDLIVLPEVCDRPGNLSVEARREYYEARGDRMAEMLASFAAAHRCYVTYPAVRKMADGTWRNSVTLFDRGGQVAGAYRKNYLVPHENTQGRCLYGSKAQVIECDFGRVGMLICFDLNFDELLNTYANQRPDLLLFCSMYHGGLMQRYWAYTCRCHFASAIAGLASGVTSPIGEVVAQSSNYTDSVTTPVNLDCRVVHLDFEPQIRAMKQRHGRDVTIIDPGHLGSVLVTSEHKDITISQMLSEFQLPDIDDYFASARAHRAISGNIEP
jgi:hypothetical protein